MTRSTNARLSVIRAFSFSEMRDLDTRWVAKFRSQEIPIFPTGDLTQSSMTRSVIAGEVAYLAVSLYGRSEESLDICFHDRPSFYDADH